MFAPVHQLVGKVEAVLLPFRFVQNLAIPHEHEAAVAQVRGMDVPLVNLVGEVRNYNKYILYKLYIYIIPGYIIYIYNTGIYLYTYK